MSLKPKQSWWLEYKGRNLCTESLLIAQEMCTVVQDVLALPQIPINERGKLSIGCGTWITEELLVLRQTDELLRRARVIADLIKRETARRALTPSVWCVRYCWMPCYTFNQGGMFHVLVGEQGEPRPDKDRWKERARTYQGVADAMAGQWS